MLTEVDDSLPPLSGCEGECATICWPGCQGFNINHNKFALFSELEDGSRWVVVGADPVLDILDGVECDDDSLIRVAHSRFEAQRSNVAKRLRTLAEHGCDVHVIARSEPGKRSPGTSVVDELEDLITVLPYKGPELRGRRNALHTKLILIKARYRGSEEPHHIVLTGSHNLSITSLRLNDEVLLRIDDEAVFDSYAGFWESIIEAHQDRLTDDG